MEETEVKNCGENCSCKESSDTTCTGKCKCKEAISKLKSDLNDSNDKYVRLYAELDTFKRRVQKEKEELKDNIKKLLKIKHSKINCGPFMRPINAVIDTDGVIYALSESEEKELKQVRSSYNSSVKFVKSSVII